MMAARSSDQRIASWAFGSILILFALFLMVWGPESLPLWKQRLLGFLCALLSGLFSYFFIGTASFLPNRIPVKASGGVAVFLIVLWWWFSGLAPIPVAKITPQDLSATIRISAIDEESESVVEQLDKLLGVDPVVSLKITTDSPISGIVWSNQFRQATETTSQLKSANAMKSEERHPTVDGTTVTKIVRFNEFVGQLGKFEDRQNLAGSSLVALLSTKTTDFALVNEILDKHRASAQEAFDDHYKPTASDKTALEDANSSLAALPLKAVITVYVDGEPIWSSTGYLARLWEGDEDVRGLINVYFVQSKYASV